MLNLIFGIEDSFIKSLVYVIVLASLVIMSGSLIYIVMVGLPMYLHKFAFDYADKHKNELENDIQAEVTIA